MKSRPLLGAHLSAAGTFTRALDRAEVLRADCLQIFTRAPAMWRCREVTEEEVARFRSRRAEIGNPPLLAHDIYLTNLAATDEIRARSIATLAEERRRCAMLGVDALVCHMGAHVGRGLKPGLRRFADGLREVLLQTGGNPVRILLESSAGQGTCLGTRFEDLAVVLERVDSPDVGVCIDTCHVFAAGYDLRTEEGYAATWDDFERYIGFSRLGALHLNDSKQPLGSRRDRHEHIGRGEIGQEAFARLLCDPRMHGRPMVLETPDNQRMDEINLKLLRRLSRPRKVKRVAGTEHPGL